MGKAIESAVRSIGRVFGIYSHDEIHVDLQIKNLLTPDAADKSARRTAKHKAMGNVQQYFLGYKMFQRDYRKKYSQQFMERQGYAPTSSAVSRTIIPSKVATYLEGLYGYTSITVNTAKDAYLTTNEKGRHAVRTLPGYDFPTGHIVDNNKTYIVDSYTEATVTQININTTREYNETIVSDLTTNYSYDGTYATIAGKQYVVGTIDGIVGSSGEYETPCTREYADVTTSAYVTLSDNSTPACIVSYPDDVNNDGDVTTNEITGGIVNVFITLPAGAEVDDVMTVTINGVDTNYTVTQTMIDNGYNIEYTGYSTVVENTTINTALEHKVYSVTNNAYGSEASYAEYVVTSGEVGIETRYWVDVADSQNVYIKINVTTTAIVTMKESGILKDTTNNKLKRMLRKLNIGADQLVSSISDTHMDSAYLMTGINPAYDDPVINRTLYDTFDLLSAGNENVVVNINKLSLRYSYTMTKSVITGNIGSVGTIVRVNSGSGASAGIVLKLQRNAVEYTTLSVSSFVMTYTVSGHNFTAYLDGSNGYCRIIIPLDILNGLKYKDFVWVYERSLCLTAYSVQVVHVKWYETGAFGVLMKIVAIVVTVVSLGSASSIGAALWTMAEGAAIAFTIGLVAHAIGGDVGMILGAIATVYAMAKFGGFDMTSMKGWLLMAEQAISVEQQHIQHELANLQAQISSFATDMNNKFKALSDKQDAFNAKHSDDTGYMNMFDPAYTGRQNPIYSTDALMQVAQPVDMAGLIDYGQQIDYNIGIRNSVRSTL